MYDFNKNIWINLPKLKYKHYNYPLMWIEPDFIYGIGNQLLFIVGSNDDSNCEMIDLRDYSQKWIDCGSIKQNIKNFRKIFGVFNLT